MSNEVKPDWETLNAYVDGELSAAQTAEVESAVAKDPVVRAEVARIAGLKAALQQGPDLGGGTASKAAATGASTRTALVAACVALLIGISALLSWQGRGEDWAVWSFQQHQMLSARSFVVQEPAPTPVISTSGKAQLKTPDLSESGLFLVDLSIVSREGHEAVTLHYRGLRGCRLTFVAVTGDAEIEGKLSAAIGGAPIVVDRWSGPSFGYLLFASGMDRMRFAAIGAYLRQHMVPVNEPEEELRMALRESYEASAPCA